VKATFDLVQKWLLWFVDFYIRN